MSYYRLFIANYYVIVVAIIGLTNGCKQRYNISHLEDLLQHPEEVTTQQLIETCNGIGQGADDILKRATDSEHDIDTRLKYIKTLLHLDTNKYLIYVIKQDDIFNSRSEHIIRYLEGRLNKQSEIILHGIIRDEMNIRFIAALRILDRIADSPETLDLAKHILRSRNLSTDETIAAIGLLANASYYNNDMSAIDDIKPFIDHQERSIRNMIWFCLVSIPGEEVDTLIKYIGKHSPDGYDPSIVNAHLIERKRLMGINPRIAPGWSSKELERRGIMRLSHP